MKSLARFHPSPPHSRDDPPPPFESIPPIPICYDMIGGHRVYHTSSPIFRVENQEEEFCVQAFPKEMSDLLRSDRRGVLRVGQGEQKSFRLKHDCLAVREVAWFALTTSPPKSIRHLLKREVLHLSTQRKRGKGRVADWVVEPIDRDYSWFAKHKSGTVLMRNLPECDELPADLIGYITEYNAVTPPYWHPGRKIDAVVPC